MAVAALVGLGIAEVEAVHDRPESSRGGGCHDEVDVVSHEAVVVELHAVQGEVYVASSWP